MATLNNDFIDALAKGLVLMQEEAKTPEPHWYPCGFAWLTIPMRKNGALAKTLVAHGFRWNDYRKAYTYSMPKWMKMASDMSQSMNYAERCLKVLAGVLTEAGFKCHVETRID